MTLLLRIAQQLRLVAKDSLKIVLDAQLPMVASSLAYTTILSIIPVLAMSFSIFKAFGGMDKFAANTIEPYIFANLAEGTSDQVVEVLRGFIANVHAGVLGVSGLIGVIVTCMSMLSSVEKAINRVWKTNISRTVFYRISSYWLVITMGPLALAFAIGFATTQALPITRFLPGNFGTFCVAVGVFMFLNKAVPNRKVHWGPTIISSILTAIAWNVAKTAYAAYTARVLTYDKIYGSLGAIPILLLWIYIAWLIVLGGAALTAAIQRRFDL